jgi:hypothetical protein
MHLTVSPQDLAEQELYLGPARAALGAEAERLVAEGRAAPLEDVVASLLGD